MLSRTRLHHHNLNILKAAYVMVDDSITFLIITSTSAVTVLPQEATRFSVLNHIPITILKEMQKLQEAKLLDDSIINFKCILSPSMLIFHTCSSVYSDVVSQMGLEYILNFPVRLLKSEEKPAFEDWVFSTALYLRNVIGIIVWELRKLLRKHFPLKAFYL